MIVVPTPWPDRARVVAAEQGEEPPRDLFTFDEIREADTRKLPKHRVEWLLSRAAAKQLAVHAGLCDAATRCRIARPRLVIDGSPCDWYVSVSHSTPYAAAAIAREPVGIDVQVVRPIAESSAHLFLSDDEAEAMRACRIAHRLLHFWCAKEAAWKRAGGAITTLRQVPIALREERTDGLAFDSVETIAIADVIVALTTP